ncbi:protein of unknown function (DUF3425) [Geosmithia morbida]|uniref:Uncharacterized protein n=1 Tax=Geosmithia morbida TaxID=1094350 RepID=A0A9P4Z2S4_9HYPO|nr:protein of unknown function (DUF3425) [Geosmithia morbida]KAF4126655.1 protein of unknown function (DUF3425) [Geosmithia morbida]
MVENEVRPYYSTRATFTSTVSDTLSTFLTFTERERMTCWQIMASESFGLRDVVKYGVIHQGQFMSPEAYQLATVLPLRQWLGILHREVGEVVDISRVLTSGVRLLAGMSMPAGDVTRKGEIQHQHQHQHQHRHRHQQRRQRTHLSAMSFTSAVGANAMFLGMPAHNLLDMSLLSPFGRSSSSSSSGGSSGRDVEYRPLDSSWADLRPTAIQQTVTHHPLFDLLPWPEFRNAVITALYSNPPHVDADDLILDLWHDGIRCWRFADPDPATTDPSASASSVQNGLPWHSQSWEAAPWFLAKWAMLIGGPGSEMSRTSAWWRCMTQGM